jgi:hypothetical protein
MERRLASAQAEVKAVESVFSSLTFYFVNGAQTNISGPVILGITTGIWPTVATFVITKSSQ